MTKPNAQHAEVPPLTGFALWAAASLLATANFIAVLDMTIANVSLPHIAGAMGVTTTQGLWVITSYAVAEAIAVPLSGWLATRFGPVHVLMTAMSCFALFSALCGMAHSLAFLVFARTLQGLAGGPMMPMTQTLLRQIFPKSRLTTAMTIFAMTATIAPILGPMIGGWVCDQFSWPWIFYITVPVALVATVLIGKMIHRYEMPTRKVKVDTMGLGLLVAWVAPLQIMLDLGKDYDWFESTAICLLAVTAIVFFLAFLIWELTEEHPIVNLRVFRHRTFAVSTITLSFVFGAYFGVNVLTPLWLQTGMGYTASWAGRTTAWGSIFALLISPLMPRIAPKVDQRWMVFGGVAWIGLVTVFSRAIATTDMDYWHIAFPIMLAGLGMPFFMVPLSALSFSSVEPSEIASAAGLSSFVRTLSGALSASLIGTLWEHKTIAMHANLSGIVDRQGTMDSVLTQLNMGPEAMRALLEQMAQNQSVMLATNELVWTLGLVFFVGASLIWLAKKPMHGPGPMIAGKPALNPVLQSARR